KIEHRRNKCSKLGKKLKKVNYTYQSESENSDQENKPIVILDDSNEKEFEAEKNTSDNESQSCFNIKKKLDSCKEEAFY
ncbi:16715_t:CDS:1, partial [Cetraspora pellucida]